MLCLQPDIYQVMAAGAMQDSGSLDPLKLSNQSFLQFQQSAPNVSASLLQKVYTVTFMDKVSSS